MKNRSPRHGHRNSPPPTSGRPDPLAYYRARASQPKPPIAFDAEQAAKRAGTFAGESPSVKAVVEVEDQTKFETFVVRLPPRPPGLSFFTMQHILTPAIEDCGTRFGEIIASRIWRLAVEKDVLNNCAQFTLYSVGVMCTWVPGKPMLGDIRRTGVFAMKPEHINKAILEYYPADSIDLSSWRLEHRETVLKEAPILLGYSTGSVRLYGTVIEHEYGYRAEAAMIESIDDVLIQPELLELQHSVWWIEELFGKSRSLTDAALSDLRQRYL